MADQDSSGQLDFYQAMKDFRTMFPNMDEDIIEAVLRANNGAVDETIDVLLTMNVDEENADKAKPSSSRVDLPSQVYPDSSTSSDDDDPPPYPPPSYQNYSQPKPVKSHASAANGIVTSESAQSLQSPDAVDTANDILLNLAGLPPFDTSNLVGANHLGTESLDGASKAVDTTDELLYGQGLQGATAFPFQEEQETEVKKPIPSLFEDDFVQVHPSSLPPKMSILNHDYTGSSAAKTPKRYKQWNPPLLGPLPDEFLRIMIIPEPTSTRCPAHPHLNSLPSHQPGLVQQHRVTSPRHIRQHSSSPSRPTLSRAETLPSKSSTLSSSPKSKSKDSPAAHSGLRARTFGFRSKKQKSETDAQLTQSLQTNPMAAAHGKEEINSSVIQQMLAEVEKRSKSTLSAEEAQALEDERLALMMQNEEFLHILRQDTDFIRTLEKDRAERHGSDKKDTDEAFSHVPLSDDDEELRQRLRYMGGSSKKKFTALAKKFFTRKKKKSKPVYPFILQLTQHL